MTGAVLTSNTATNAETVSHNTLADMFFSDEKFQGEFVKLVGELLHTRVNRDAG